jgi:hypothetical protein
MSTTISLTRNELAKSFAVSSDGSIRIQAETNAVFIKAICKNHLTSKTYLTQPGGSLSSS